MEHPEENTSSASVETTAFTIVTPPSPAADDFIRRYHQHITEDEIPQCGGLFFNPREQQLQQQMMARRNLQTPPNRFFSKLFRNSSRDRKGKNRAYPVSDDDLPLDGEEGILVDDEGIFEYERETTGFDIISRLPIEISIEIIALLDLAAVVACTAVSKTWHSFAMDPTVWRQLYLRQPGWTINPTKAARHITNHQSRVVSSNSPPSVHASSISHRKLSFTSPSHTLQSNSQVSAWASQVTSSPLSGVVADIRDNYYYPPLALDWYEIYKTRRELDKRWVTCDTRVMRLSGHSDSVYCLEFDSDKIITGSRDRSIKIWCLRTGALRATLANCHEGSVLCLKFDETGFMVSGSSDRNILAWQLSSDGFSASLTGILLGHTAGVLDLRIDKKWIVSCSKDAVVRVWDRATLTPFCDLQGHDGPVNAVGLQDNKVVSASGDGKMMLWDIPTQTRLRTFEGHSRGLACIDFKGDYIISGSNDRKIKVWSASTGECLMTLSGHDLLVRALAFDPLAGRLVSASYDKTVKVWDFKTGKCVREFSGLHTSHIFDVKFDASRIVSSSHDQKIVVMDFASDLDVSLF